MRAMARKIVRYLRKVLSPKARLAVGTVDEVAQVYNHVYTNNQKYDSLDTSNEPKLRYVLDYASSIQGVVLDAGCGRGSVLRFLKDNGVDVFGIEMSSAACQKYLGGLPVENTDIVSWANKGHTYAGLINTDVLEHIPLDQLDVTIEGLRSMSPSAFFGIANHSSVHEGNELHVIQEGIGWWIRKLSEHYGRLEVIVPDRKDAVLWDHFQHERFFFVRAQD